MTDHKVELEEHGTNELIDKIIADFDSKMLSYPEKRNEYLSFEESIKLLDTPPYKFNDLIVGGDLKPCFPWSGYLKVKRKISVYEYNQLFYSDFNSDDFANYFIEEPDVLVEAYVNFIGYVRPVESAHYLNAILIGESKKIAIENVYLIENLTLDSVVHIIGNHGEAPKKELGRKELFIKHQAYKIYQGIDNNDIDIKSYVFLKDDIEQIVEKNKEKKTIKKNNIVVDFDIQESQNSELNKESKLASPKKIKSQNNLTANEVVVYTELPKTGYVNINDMLPHLPIKRSTVWKWVKNGRFPAPVKIHSLTCWRCEEIHAWLKQYSKDECDQENIE
ncbi:AlpA family phage regulatory protein [Acinetobacter baumannii]|nr:AlpA family phage regulatory protein [Acinetobacter baumannii]MDC4436141.1 AlpA family phage regulatory protein [Acinetobacter baumannii]MDC4699273.1 AlpA family phage regulatory protein [Acinetobacter baumannii]MDC5125225.1 AlpA family phage regulatory protein [Acinetobacter baumannii]MDC5609416.1 AlpA family phage regulatory protein [Acinetobacter baumannii]